LIDAEIDKLVIDTATWREKEERLRSVPGVGKIVSRTLIAFVPELGALTRRQIASLIGFAPFSRDSGTLRGRRTIWGGRANVRAVLYMALSLPRSAIERSPPSTTNSSRGATANSRPHRLHAQAPHYPQRNDARLNSLGGNISGLTRQTVAAP
jgi:hypothetical protein